MKYLFTFLLISKVICQSDFIKPSDFEDNPPQLPNVILPSMSVEDIIVKDSFNNTKSLLKGYRVQIIISQNENELIEIKDILNELIDEQIYIIFELPNYKLRVGNFLNRKEAENFQKKITRLGYRTAWVVPTFIEMED